jgi:predicted alpha/beta hydrolase family esterase
MPKQVLFLQGGGDDAYAADAALAASLRQQLGDTYTVHYPAMADEGNPTYENWKQGIEDTLASIDGPVILVGHSLGSSMALKYFAETTVQQEFAGIFLLATPYWGGDDGWRYDGYEELVLPEDLADKLPTGAPVFLYHCRDDAVVPFAHLALYEALLPQASVRQPETGGHQFDDNLALVARDIQAIAA